MFCFTAHYPVSLRTKKTLTEAAYRIPLSIHEQKFEVLKLWPCKRAYKSKPGKKRVALSSGGRDKVNPVVFRQSRLTYKEKSNKSFERVKQFKYLETALTNRNFIHEEVKSRPISSNACYHSAQNRLPCSLLPKHINIKIYKQYFCLLFSIRSQLGLSPWGRTIGWGCFENRVLRQILGPKRCEVTGEWRILHHKELYDLYSSPNIICVSKLRKIRWAGHVACMGEEKCVHGFVEETWEIEIIPKTLA